MHRASGQSYVGNLPASALPATSNASLSLAESLAGRYTSPQKLEKLEARINEKGGEVSIGFGGGSDSRQGSGNATSLQSGESKTLLLSQGSPSLPPRHTMPPQKGGKGVKANQAGGTSDDPKQGVSSSFIKSRGVYFINIRIKKNNPANDANEKRTESGFTRPGSP